MAQKIVYISDFDDTYKITEATKPCKALYNIFFTEKDFEGNAHLYAYLQSHDSLIILSNSPKFLHRKITRQLNHDSIYRFGLVLKPLFKRGKNFKVSEIRKIVSKSNKNLFILIGDNGQKDPLIYQNLKKKIPHRIKAIYIHIVMDKNKLKDVNYYENPEKLEQILVGKK